MTCDDCGDTVYSAFCDKHRIWCFECSVSIPEDQILCKGCADDFGVPANIKPEALAFVDEDGVVVTGDSEVSWNI